MLQVTDKDFKLILGAKAIRNYRTIENQSGLILDEVNIVLDNTLQQDVNLFYIPKHHRRLKIENARINIRYNRGNTKYKIYLFNNNSRELTV